MQRYIKTETFYLRPCDKIVSMISSIGDEQGYTTSGKATVTDWNLEIPQLENYLNVLYPKHQVQELWGCTYRQGDYAKTHNHTGYAYAFVWFVAANTSTSPLVFPNTECPWLPPLTVIQPKRGKIVVFDAEEYHYCLLYTSPSPRDS